MDVQDVVTEAAKKAHWWFTAMLVSAIGLLLSGMGIAAYVGGFARAETVAKIETKQQAQAEDIAAIKAIIPFVRATFEAVRSEQYRLHGVVIPDPAAPDGGAR